MDNLLSLPQHLLVLTETKNKDSSISSLRYQVSITKKLNLLKEHTKKILFPFKECNKSLCMWILRTKVKGDFFKNRLTGIPPKCKGYPCLHEQNSWYIHGIVIRSSQMLKHLAMSLGLAGESSSPGLSSVSRGLCKSLDIRSVQSDSPKASVGGTQQARVLILP